MSIFHSVQSSLKPVAAIFLVSTLAFSSISASANTIYIGSAGPASNSDNRTISVNNNNTNSGVIRITLNGNNNSTQIQGQTQTINLTGNTNSNPNFDTNDFNIGGVIPDNSLYNTPDRFSSPDKINDFLRSRGSLLADLDISTSLESDDDSLSNNRNDKFSSKNTLVPYQGKTIRFANVVWELSHGKLGNFCSLKNQSVCYDSESKSVNPAFILGMIQRESGLVYGRNSVRGNDTDFLLDRATGYLCLETEDHTKTCYDENPNWKYYKGIFKQTLYMYRNLMLNSTRCGQNGVGFSNFKTGNTVEVDGDTFKLETNIACALYIYTPHASAQKSLFRVIKNIGGM